MASQYTMEYLKELQGYPLEIKIQLTKQRIREWVHRYGEDGVCISFSGGKDSTVLLHLVREMYGDVIPGVFVDTGLEYPEIREFVRSFDNIIWLRPEMNFRKVIETYGYPFISKEVSQCVYSARKYLTETLPQIKSLTDRQTDSGISGDTTKLWDLANTKEFAEFLKRNKGKIPAVRISMMLGMFTTNNEIKTAESIPSKSKSSFAKTRYKFLLDSQAPMVSSYCCDVMKKRPVHKYFKESGRLPFTAEMASESKLRTIAWLKNGCNGFDMTNPKSTPMAFWTEQDVLLYIYMNHIPIASVYGDVIKENEVDGQLDFADIGLFDLGRQVLKTTGCKRTGCMFCGYGCHLEPEGEGRFERLKITHPKIYDYIMRPWEEGGLNYKEVIDWINEHGDLHIRY